MRNAPGLGISFMIAAMFCISVNDALIKLIGLSYPLHQIVFIRNGIACLVILILIWRTGGFAQIRTKTPGLHMLRAALIVMANTTLYAAFIVMPLAKVTALYFVAPFFVTLLSIPILGEPVGLRRLAAIAVGFLGVLVMVAPELGGGLGWVAILPVVAAAGYASAAVLTRKLGQATSAAALALYLQLAFLLFTSAMFLIAGDGKWEPLASNDSLRFLLMAWRWPDAQDWPFLIALGALSAGIGYFISQAYRQAPASTVAPFEYVLMIFSIFWGYTLFDEWPAPSVFAGAAIIVASGFYIVWRERRIKALS
ncbi:DMT family transporter [Aestuariivita boseongensis]|uniref:DMT family transporter n=1 Tax=Aestuariivita boseongensis TaxID=1470562 RepID=UPI001FDEABBC|nr:DMT family transporter [Aestuariivita boseongensis]